MNTVLIWVNATWEMLCWNGDSSDIISVYSIKLSSRGTNFQPILFSVYYSLWINDYLELNNRHSRKNFFLKNMCKWFVSWKEPNNFPIVKENLMTEFKFFFYQILKPLYTFESNSSAYSTFYKVLLNPFPF